MGKLSREWLRLQPSYNDWQGNNRQAYIWEAAVVETRQRSYIELWEQRNADAHSPQAHIHLEKARSAKAIQKFHHKPQHQ